MKKQNRRLCYCPSNAKLEKFHPKATRKLFNSRLSRDIAFTVVQEKFERFAEILETAQIFLGPQWTQCPDLVRPGIMFLWLWGETPLILRRMGDSRVSWNLKDNKIMK